MTGRTLWHRIIFYIIFIPFVDCRPVDFSAKCSISVIPRVKSIICVYKILYYTLIIALVEVFSFSSQRLDDCFFSFSSSNIAELEASLFATRKVRSLNPSIKIKTVILIVLYFKWFLLFSE